MIQKGSTEKLGASWDGAGVNFALYSQSASAVELCLFEPGGKASARYFLPDCDKGVWHGYLPGCSPGQHYGYRIHGDYAPESGIHHNAHKLLIDPYARQLSGPVIWSPALFGYRSGSRKDSRPSIDIRDSAAFVPKSIVQGEGNAQAVHHPRIAWKDTILYELNVRGFTMNHPAVSQRDKGRITGLAVKEILQYLKALGITTIELLPCHAFVDEQFLVERGLRNFWGYNTINFFSPHTRYLRDGRINEFREMTNAIHDAGMEVVLDVVYNHTAEGGPTGPTLSFRGIDNLCYYRTLPHDPAIYINDTGCGNTINADHPRVQALVCDSLRYWVQEMGVDGFRFDLGSILGRRATGFDPQHPLLQQISTDPVLGNVKLIAEPWDIGPGGYQLGNFPAGWSEWNDQFRDATRRFWRGDHGQTPVFARRLHGSADIFESRGRLPSASINFITSHDGYTLMDLVSYEQRHNEGNGEQNRDGHQHNHSFNFGFEGPTDDLTIEQKRRRQRLNLLASLLLGRGTPMMLGGDEFGNSQNGNNNAYAQDNPLGWLDWSGLETDPDFTETVRRLIKLRRDTELIMADVYLHGRKTNSAGETDITWLDPDGTPLSEDKWPHHRAFTLGLLDADATPVEDCRTDAVVIMFNASQGKVSFALPTMATSGQWYCAFSSDSVDNSTPRVAVLQAHSCACFVYGYTAPRVVSPDAHRLG